jgi:TolB-like protein
MNQISTASQSIHLRAQLMEVLVYLADLEGQVATLESIHDDLWTGKVVSSGTIYNCIAELRQAFASGGSNIEYIETLPKKGYRLAPPIITHPAATERNNRAASIAILPLVNRSGSKDIEYLCDGISDEILFGLSGIKDLNVYSAGSLKQEKLDARVVGLRFGAQMVLSGSLQTAGKRFRAMFRLEYVADGEVVWSGRFDQTMDNLFDLQDQVARQVIDAISPALPVKPPDNVLLEGSGTRSLDALNAFLLGKHALSRSTRQSHEEAIGFFERAVGLDPAFARAHYLLYLANYMKCRHFGAGEEAVERARRAAENAEASGFRPAVPWIHIHRRLHPDDRLSSRDLALEAIGKLHDRDPDWGSFAYEQLTWVLTDAGLFDATLDFAKRMLASPYHNFEDSDADEELPHYVAACGQYDEAIRLWSALIQKEPARPLFHCERSILYSRSGQFDYAAKDIDALNTPRHDIMSRAFLAYYQGDAERTLKHHQALLELPYAHPTYLLWTYGMVGDIDNCLDEYEKSVNEERRHFIDFGNVRAMSRAKLPPELVEEIENHDRFKELLRRQGIDDAWKAELIERLNEISDVTGIIVRIDE